MIENLLICIRAVLPLFLLMMVGYVARKINVIDEVALPKLNSLVFKVFFPFLMFNNVYKSDLTAAFDPVLLIFAISAVFATYFLGTAYTCYVEKDHKARGALIQGIYRSNLVIIGLPLASNIFGSGNIGTTAIATAVVVPLFNVLAVITLERFRAGKVNYRSMLLNIAKNPLILGAVGGCVGIAAGHFHGTFSAGTV